MSPVLLYHGVWLGFGLVLDPSWWGEPLRWHKLFGHSFRYTKEEELACDLNGQQLAAKAGYSPAGMLTLLETFKALRKGEPEEPSEKHRA